MFGENDFNKYRSVTRLSDESCRNKSMRQRMMITMAGYLRWSGNNSSRYDSLSIREAQKLCESLFGEYPVKQWAQEIVDSMVIDGVLIRRSCSRKDRVTGNNVYWEYEPVYF